MKEENGEIKEQAEKDAIRVHAETVIKNRALLAARMGMSFGNKRDLYEQLGYKRELGYKDYILQYSRHDMAKAIINRPVKATWRGDVNLLESKDDKETTLEKEWKALERDLKLKSTFVRVDKLASLGEFALILLGFNDINDRNGWREPVKKGIRGGRKLLYAKPISQAQAEIKTWEDDPGNPRYGKPLIYEITLSVPGHKGETYTLFVHYSRVVHVTIELLQDEILGEPVLKSVFNRLTDLEKLVGGSAEMFWKGARPGYDASVLPEYNMGEEEEQKLQTQIDEYEHGLRRMLHTQGVDIKALEMQISDPASHVDIQVQMISAITGIPKRVLVGSERGELASSQDQETWKELIQERREEHAEPNIIIPFVDYMIEMGVLPKPAKEHDYTVAWSDLFAPSEKERSEIGKTKAEALARYASALGAEDIIPAEAFMEFFLGLDQEQINLIKEIREQAMLDEERDFENRPDDGEEFEEEDSE